MNRLEDKLKESFEHFEPEVNPSVWTKVNTQLQATPPVQDGGSSISSSVTKGLLSKLGPIAGYIGGAAALITVAAILWKLNSKSAGNQQSPVQPIVIKNEQSTLEINSGNTGIEGRQSVRNANVESANKSEYVSIQSNNTSTRKHTLTENTSVSASQNRGAEAEDVHSLNLSNTATTQTESDRSQSSTSVKVVDKEEVKSNRDPEDSPSKAIASPSEKDAPMVLMVNTRGGFAPLMVTAFTNQNEQTADYDFGDGFVSNGVQRASHKFENPGIYTIRCKLGGQELETTIEVLGQLSTVFSPNGDGINDLFTAESPGAGQIEMQIYDRSGKKMFGTKGTQVSWDGKMPDGRLAETGTYFYNIFATSVNGVTYKQKGIISLFR
jgi:gliding motility-associated-like protein